MIPNGSLFAMRQLLASEHWRVFKPMVTPRWIAPSQSLSGSNFAASEADLDHRPTPTRVGMTVAMSRAHEALP